MSYNEIEQRLMKAESAEEAIAVAKENGVELTAEQAARLFEEISARKAAVKLDVDELTAVTGGDNLQRLDGICKATVEVSMVSIDKYGNIFGFRVEGWCWFGSDSCMWQVETYPEYEH